MTYKKKFLKSKIKGECPTGRTVNIVAFEKYFGNTENLHRISQKSKYMSQCRIFLNRNVTLQPYVHCIERTIIINSSKRFSEDGLINLMIASAEMHAIIIDVGREKGGKKCIDYYNSKYHSNHHRSLRIDD